MPTAWLAEVDAEGVLQPLVGPPREVSCREVPAPGTVVRVDVGADGQATVVELAAAGSARADLYRLIGRHELDPEYPPEVLDEVQAWARAPGIDDPKLRDQTDVPYVTVDGPETRDLDQALAVQPCDGGHLVRYAIADAAWFVRPGTALFREALRRGATYYLPGLSVPMLPRALSEGLVSLNPARDRRAMVFEMTVDADGECTKTEIVRARIHSRAKLSFERVQALLDGVDGHGIDDPAVAQSLVALREVGERRIARAAARGVVGHRNAEVRIELVDREGLDFVVFAQPRNAVERYSEQLSLLCNVEGARLLRGSSPVAVQPIYRTHDAPDPERLDELATMIETVAREHGLGRRFRWDPARRSLADFLRELPPGRVTRALARQAIMVNVRSTFSAEPGPHFGIGADVYARFSAPMREVVGVFVHKEMWDRETGRMSASDDEVRAEVIERANAARELQRELTREANLLVLDRLFARELERPIPARPVRTGTVMGIRRGRLYVQLDEPPVDVKVYTEPIDPTAVPSPDGALMQGEALRVRLGDEVTLRLHGRDHAGHWLLSLVE